LFIMESKLGSPRKKPRLSGPGRDGDSFLFLLPEAVRLKVLSFVGFTDCTNLPSVNFRHRALLRNNDLSKILLVQKWGIATELQTALDGCSSMSWFDMSLVLLSLISQLSVDLFSNFDIPDLLQDLWFEKKLGEFFNIEMSGPTLLGLQWEFLSSTSHYNRTLQNALAPETVHDEGAYTAPHFGRKIVFFGRVTTDVSSYFLGLWVADITDRYYRNNINNCPVVEWDYHNNEMKITFLSFSDFLCFGGQPACMPSRRSPEHTVALGQWLQKRKLSLKLPASLAVATRQRLLAEHQLSIEKKYSPEHWTPKFKQLLDSVLERNQS